MLTKQNSQVRLKINYAVFLCFLLTAPSTMCTNSEEVKIKHSLDQVLNLISDRLKTPSFLAGGTNDPIDLCSIPENGSYISLLIRSPLDPVNKSTYPPNKRCQKTIKAATPGSKLVLSFEADRFHLEDSEGCVRDYLLIEDAMDASHVVRCCGFRCGNSPVNSDYVFISESGSLNLTFVSDHVIQKTGFRAQLAEIIKPECIGEPNLLATVLEVTALQTNSSSDCRVTIKGASHDDVLRVKFQRFRLPYSGPNCVYDRLEFQFNYAPENGTSTKTMCGIQSMPEFIINANKVQVRFVNDLSRLPGIFSFRYFSINERFWVTLRQPYYYHHEQQHPLAISVHELEPNQRCRYFVDYIDDIVVTFYEFKFSTVVGRRFSAQVILSPPDNATTVQSLPKAMVYFSDRFICTTPSKLLNIQDRYVYRVPIDPITSKGTISTQSFEMMIYVATFGDKLQNSVYLEVDTDDLEIYAGHLDFPISKGATFSLTYATLIDYMRQKSMQLHTSQMLIGAPRTNGLNHVYWNITSFDLDSQYSDESCNKTGLFVIKRDTMTIGEKLYGPFCSSSSLPVSILSHESEVYFLLYYFHDLDIQESDPPSSSVFTYSLGAYPCEMFDLSEVVTRLELYHKECLTILSEVQVTGRRNKTVEIIGSEPLLVFSKFTSSNLMALTENQNQNVVTLTLMKKFNCESIVSIKRRYVNDRYYAVVTLQSDCDFCATFWTLHLETKCRARIPHNDISTIGGPGQRTVEQECGIMESPGFPFPYEKYEKPIVWFFNYTGPRNVSSYYAFHFSVFDLDSCFNSFLTIMERVSARYHALYQCNKHSGSYFYTLSSKQIYIMFQANKISYGPMKSSLQSRYQGFSIRFRLVQEAAKPAPEACPLPGSEDWILISDSCYRLVKPAEPVSWDHADVDCKQSGGHLVSINSRDEIRDLMELILYKKEWQDELYSSDDVFVFIGLLATSHAFVDQECARSRPSSRCWLWGSNRNVSRNDFIWSSGEPLTYQEWYPSHNDSLFEKVPKNLPTVVQEKFPQPNYYNAFLCVGMMLQNPRHHTNWVQVPCNMEIHGQSHICEKTANPTALEDKKRQHFKQQVSSMQSRARECSDGWYELDGSCYMIVSAAPNVSKLNKSEAIQLCSALNASIAHESNNTARLTAMIRSWKYPINRGRIYIFSSPTKHAPVGRGSGSPQSSRSESDKIFIDPADDLLEKEESFRNSDDQLNVDWAYIIPPRAVLCWRSTEPMPDKCDGHEFQCQDSSCISSDYTCNGVINCPGGEDEANCTEVLQSRYFKCDNEQLVTWSRYCNHRRDCADGSDERNCQFAACDPENEFTCESSRRCIPITKRCDGVPMDCEFNQDEEGCRGECRGFQCRSETSRCLPRYFVNDTQVDCPGTLMEDEDGSCLRDGDCLQSRRFWEFPDCDSPLEERCMINHVKCFSRRDACMFNTKVLGKQACPNLEHLTACDEFQCPGQFQCQSGSGYCIPTFRVCDGIADCPSATDEASCNASFSLHYHFRCRGPGPFDIFVPRTRVCNGAADCPGGEDELYCDQLCPHGCYCIGYSVSCKGNETAHEFHPEQVSPQTRALILDGNNKVKLHSKFLANFTYLGLLSIKYALINSLPGNLFASSANLVVLDLRDNQIAALNSNTLFGLTNLLDLRLSGNPLATIEPFAFRSLRSIVNLQLQELRIAELPEYALAGMENLRTLNLSNNPLWKLHELSFSNGSNWYSTIDLRVCENVLVHQHTFASLDRVDTFLSNSFKFCCLLEHTRANCTPQDNDFNSCKDLLGRVGQRIAVWIYGAVALVGNVLVIGVRLYRRKVKTSSDFIIFNVSLADLLMAVYLLSVATVDAHFHDRYILFDDLWRQHPACSLIGMVFLISTETSITFLAFLSLERYLSIVDSVGRSHRGLTMRKTVSVVVATWFASLALACAMLIRENKMGNAYSRTSACVPLVTNSDHLWSITLLQYLFVVYNAAAFLLAAICYGRIFMHIRATRKSAKRRSMEQDHLLARRLFVLVATNLVTWIPTIIMYLCLAIGVHMPISMITGFILFVLPVNPSLNPYLYTLSTMRMFCRETRRKIDQAKVLQAISTRVEPRRGVVSSVGSYRRRCLAAPRGSTSIETQTVVSDE